MTAQVASRSSLPGRAFVFAFIEDGPTDFRHVLGASWAGMAYVALIVAFVPHLDATEGAVGFGREVGVTVGIYGFVFLSYAWLFDGTHVFATWARLLGGEDERRYFPAVVRSMVVLAVGPALVMLAALADHLQPGPSSVSATVAIVLVVVYQLRGLHHVNRQHWGLVCMYRACAGETDPRSRRADAALLSILAWAPLVSFASSGALASCRGFQLFPSRESEGTGRPSTSSLASLRWSRWLCTRRRPGDDGGSSGSPSTAQSFS